MSEFQSLPFDVRRIARRKIRSLWISHKDIDRATEDFKKDEWLIGLDPATIFLILKLVALLLQLWFSTNNKEPRLAYDPSEPGYERESV